MCVCVCVCVCVCMYICICVCVCVTADGPVRSGSNRDETHYHNPKRGGRVNPRRSDPHRSDPSDTPMTASLWRL